MGAGRLGLIVATVLAAAGKDVSIVTRRRADALPLGCWRWGPLYTYMVPILSLADSDSDNHAIPDDSFDTVVDCTGDLTALATAVRLTRPRGTVALKSTVANPAPMDLSPVVVKELTIRSSRCGPFDVALRFFS